MKLQNFRRNLRSMIHNKSRAIVRRQKLREIEQDPEFTCVSTEVLARRPPSETAQAEADLLWQWAKKIVCLLDNAVADGCDAGEVVWIANVWLANVCRKQNSLDKDLKP